MASLQQDDPTPAIGALFTVVIINLNGADTLPGAVRSALAEGVPQQNILVVDNGSTDRSIPTLQQAFPLLQLFRNDRNLGFARAANIGLRAASSAFILLLNNDAELRPGCLAHFLTAFRQSPRLALVGGQLLYPDGRLQSAFAPLPTLLEELVPRSFLKLLRPRRFRRTSAGTSVREVESVFGACLAARAAALPTIGLLDEDFFFYFEEIDWCRRATGAGWRVAYIPEARTLHLAGHTAHKFGSAARIELERSKLIYFRKTLPRTSFRILSAYLGLRAGINALSCTLASAFGGQRNAKLRSKASTYRDLLRWHLTGRPQSAGLPRSFAPSARP